MFGWVWLWVCVFLLAFLLCRQLCVENINNAGGFISLRSLFLSLFFLSFLSMLFKCSKSKHYLMWRDASIHNVAFWTPYWCGIGFRTDGYSARCWVIILHSQEFLQKNNISFLSDISLWLCSCARCQIFWCRKSLSCYSYKYTYIWEPIHADYYETKPFLEEVSLLPT